MISRLKTAISQASNDTAQFMTRQVRHRALNDGWDKDVVANLHVVHENGKFSARVHPELADRAFVHEFGDENTRPNATLRKFSNDNKVTKSAFMANLNKRYGGLK